MDENGRYPCNQCKASYKNKGHLVRHLRFECGVEPRFKCVICSRKFKHKCNLKAHFFLMHTKTCEYLKRFPF